MSLPTWDSLILSPPAGEAGLLFGKEGVKLGSWQVSVGARWTVSCRLYEQGPEQHWGGQLPLLSTASPAAISVIGVNG